MAAPNTLDVSEAVPSLKSGTAEEWKDFIVCEAEVAEGLEIDLLVPDPGELDVGAVEGCPVKKSLPVIPSIPD